MVNKLTKKVNWRYHSSTASLKKIREDLRVYLGSMDIDILNNIVIAVNEACMNIIQHGSGGNYDGDINLFIQFDDNQVLLEIIDDADLADINSLVPLEKDLLIPGGHGLHIINEIMDGVCYSHVNSISGNKVILIKQLRGQHGL